MLRPPDAAGASVYSANRSAVSVWKGCFGQWLRLHIGEGGKRRGEGTWGTLE